MRSGNEIWKHEFLTKLVCKGTEWMLLPVVKLPKPSSRDNEGVWHTNQRVAVRVQGDGRVHLQT